MTDGSDPSGIAPYRWTCPICQVSKSGIAGADENWRTKALGSLKTHIRGRTGDGHGPHRALPPNLDEETLARCIEKQEGP